LELKAEFHPRCNYYIKNVYSIFPKKLYKEYVERVVIVKKDYLAPECMEIGKLISLTQSTLQGDVPDGVVTEDGDPDPMGGHQIS